jgi:hypothetical protein
MPQSKGKEMRKANSEFPEETAARIRLPAWLTSDLQPNKYGSDVASADGRFDGHVRLERLRVKDWIMVDIFDSRIQDAHAAHLEGYGFTNDLEGAEAATNFLHKYNIDVRIRVPTRSGRSD